VLWPRFVLQGLALILIGTASAGSAPILMYEATLSLPHSETREGLPVAVTAGADGSICVTDATTQSGHLFDEEYSFTARADCGLSEVRWTSWSMSPEVCLQTGRRAGGRSPWTSSAHLT
jgi:hypothetical protein